MGKRMAIPAGEYVALEADDQPLRRACAAGQVPGAVRMGGGRGGCWIVPAAAYELWAAERKRRAGAVKGGP